MDWVGRDVLLFSNSEISIVLFEIYMVTLIGLKCHNNVEKQEYPCHLSVRYLKKNRRSILIWIEWIIGNHTMSEWWM